MDFRFCIHVPVGCVLAPRVYVTSLDLEIVDIIGYFYGNYIEPELGLFLISNWNWENLKPTLSVHNVSLFVILNHFQ